MAWGPLRRWARAHPAHKEDRPRRGGRERVIEDLLAYFGHMRSSLISGFCFFHYDLFFGWFEVVLPKSRDIILNL